MTKIIVALDYTNPLDALEMAAKLRGHVDGFKTNHTLWSQSVYIKDYTEGHELFIDCKLWDTPNTVKQVLQKIVDKGATMTTVSTLNSQSVFEEVSQFADKIKRKYPDRFYFHHEKFSNLDKITKDQRFYIVIFF